MLFQKNYKANLTSTLAATNTGELEVRLNVEPAYDMGFLLFEPGVTGKEETCLYHRKSGNYVYIYGCNRDNPTEHLIGTPVMLTNSIDSLNYLLGFVGQAGYIYKKDLKNIVIKGGKFYINNTVVDIPDVDTSVGAEDQELIINTTNYIYIKNNKYYIDDDVWSYFPIATVVVDASGNITSITNIKFSEIYQEFGFAPLDEHDKIPFQYLPAIFGSIEEYSSIGDFPLVGDTGILYTVTGSALGYRWTGTQYVAMGGIGDLFSANNLSDLIDVEEARDNLNVYSQTETNNLLDLNLKISENLNDLEDKVEARTNLDVYSKSETDALTETAIYDTFMAGEDLDENDLFRFGITSFSSNITLPSSYITIGVGTTVDVVSFTCESNYYKSVISNIFVGIAGNGGNVSSGYFTITDTSNNILYQSNTQGYSAQTSLTFTFTGVDLAPGNYKLRYTDIQYSTLLLYPSGSYSFSITKYEQNNLVYKANSLNKINSNVIGIVPQTITSGTIFKGLLYGTKNNNFISTLTDGNIYLQDDGSIGNNPGTINILLGKYKLQNDRIYFNNKKQNLITTTSSISYTEGFPAVASGTRIGTLSLDLGVEWNTIMFSYILYSYEDYNDNGASNTGVCILKNSQGVKGISLGSEVIAGGSFVSPSYYSGNLSLSNISGSIGASYVGTYIANILKVYCEGTNLKVDYSFTYNTASGGSAQIGIYINNILVID